MKQLTNLDLSKNELQNAVLQPLATAPSSPKLGQMYYDTTDKTIKSWNGTAWKASGGAGTWSDLTGKPFSTIGDGLSVVDDALVADGIPTITVTPSQIIGTDPLRIQYTDEQHEIALSERIINVDTTLLGGEIVTYYNNEGTIGTGHIKFVNFSSQTFNFEMVGFHADSIDYDTSTKIGVYSAWVYSTDVEGKISTALADYTTTSDLTGLLADKADKSTVLSHTGDTTIHVTTTEKNTWNAKQDAIPANTYDAYGAAAAVQSNLDTHDGNTTKHITAQERTTWNAKQDAIPANTYDAYGAAAVVQTNLDAVTAKISSAASSTNKLVSASEMGDAIEAVEAKQLYATNAQGSFATKSALTSATTFYNADGTVATPTKNDVAYVLADESHDGKAAKYVIASVSPVVWGFVIAFSDTTFTQAQMNTINSGLTAADKTKLDGLTAVKTATGTLTAGTTSKSVSYTGTVIGTIVKDASGNEVIVDVAIAASSVTFTVAQAAAAALTCIVIYI